MLKNKKRLLFFLTMIASLIGEVELMRSFAPNQTVSIIGIQTPILPFFFILLFLFLFSTISFILKKPLQGILIGVFVNIYLLFRYFGFTKLLYQILLLLIFVSIELFFFQKHREKQ